MLRIAAALPAIVPGVGAAATRSPPDRRGLRLVHLHRMDYAICLERHRVRSRRRWADDDLAWSLARHNRIVEETEFDRWFYSESGFENHGIGIELETVPASWRAEF